MRRLGHVPALDGVRGIAILLVLLNHLGWLPAGLVGVDVFFALSGFLITTLLLEERETTGGINYRAFYQRRARRLLPGLFAVVFLISLAYTLGRHDWRELAYAGSILLYVGNIVRVTGHVFPHGLDQMWSLAEEEQFYFLWPALLILLLRHRSAVTLARGLIVAAVLVVAWRTACWFAWTSAPHTILSPDTRSDALLLGCALGAARAAAEWRPPRLLVASALPAAVTLFAVAALPATGWLIAAIPAAALLSIAALAGAVTPGSLAARTLAFRPLCWLGVISYSVYLWHLAVFNVPASPLLKLVFAIAVGAASYHWIEKPFRRRRPSRSVERAPESAFASVSATVQPE